ncbi:site-specific DNA-methyltransferase [Mycoplasma zalophidermidis]|uniref:Site-specific DNA-methyltransferase n=1 Tax=Mycoplasma zalophidermidis TaxID=398174 RepID=A0ABS6DSG1_9MOLU|nr:DNA methyltransferase [Mycoplasma zalophidermidis]MBU4693957.1 site-specific DNA-methyltransferase [Mycoplasma zalophidermidis]
MNNKIFIGDNLEVMSSKYMTEFQNKIQTIYIDPPYNTLNVKSYKDNINTSDWIEMMKLRLIESKKFLKETGVIFISIDDNEYANLKVLCDEIFGKRNYIGTFITNQSKRSNAIHINTTHEYVLCYGKNKKKTRQFEVKRMDIPENKKLFKKLNCIATELVKNNSLEIANKKFKKIINNEVKNSNQTWLKNYSNIDENSRIYFAMDLSTPNNPKSVSIPEINLDLKPLKSRGWASDKKFIELYKEKRLVFKDGRPYSKKYLEEATENAQSVLNYFSRQGTNDLKKIGLAGLFDTPKPVELIKFLIRISTNDDDVVLDYFAGSGTTAQAVYELNSLEKRNNKYILIQTKEPVKTNTSVYKKCMDLGVKPFISDILLFRVNRYIKTKDYDLEYI